MSKEKEAIQILEENLKKIKDEAANTALKTLINIIDEMVAEHVKTHLLAVAQFIIKQWGEESIAKDNTDKQDLRRKG